HCFNIVPEGADIDIRAALDLRNFGLSHSHGFSEILLRQLARGAKFLKRHRADHSAVLAFARSAGPGGHLFSQFTEFSSHLRVPSVLLVSSTRSCGGHTNGRRWAR